MPLYLNSFPVDVTPPEVSLPYADYPDWETSTFAKKNQFNMFEVWRYQMSPEEQKEGPNTVRMVLLSGPQIPLGIQQAAFDLGRFWRIACLFIEDAVANHFAKLGYAVEQSKFERLVLRHHPGSPDERIELATGLAFSARRPFREDRYGFALSFQWVVRAMFKDSLNNDSLARIAQGMPVIYKPAKGAPPELQEFSHRFLGRVRSIDSTRRSAVVMCRDDEPRTISLADLRLESSPAVIRVYEQTIRSRPGPSQILRTIQQLNLSFTKENRRNVSALRDRLTKIRAVLQQAGSSRDQLILPLASFQAGSVSIDLNPSEATLGDAW